VRSQRILWTATPPAAEQPAARAVSISVLVAPRLRTDEGLPEPHLDLFPDFLDWPAVVRGAQWLVLLDGTSVSATLVSEPRSDLWQELFDTNTFVRPESFTDLPSRKVRSYPVANVVDFILECYRQVAVTWPTEFPPYTSLVGPALLGPVSYDPDAGVGQVQREVEQTLNKQTAVHPGAADPPPAF